MKQTIRCLLIASLIFICPNGPVRAQAFSPKTGSPKTGSPRSGKPKPALAESFYFSMTDYKMEHQGEVNLLNIRLSYEYNAGIADNQYPDFIPIRKDVDLFLTEYPGEMTFWEIVNKQLTAMVLKKYPVLSAVTCKIQVTPSVKYTFTRGSIVTRHRKAVWR
jgi:hypothetical protein